ncbi:MAG: hypothetical protein IV107_20595 [Paucibacter sp.]|nr:hypothetical protein [Roseateles sp.]
MLKIRYYRLRMSPEYGIASLACSAYKLGPESGISVLEFNSGNLVLRCTFTKQIETTQILSDGSEVRSQIPTMERHSVRFFQVSAGLMLSLMDPPRGSRVSTEVLSKLIGKDEYFIEPLEIDIKMIRGHISSFDSARLVSAKIRDFRVYDNAIGRLEISSKEGLSEEIAPFLAGKYHKVDSLTYEVTHQFKRGLICYVNSGTVRVSGPLVETAFPTFEQQF